MIPLDEVVHFDCITRGTSGVSDADSAPTFDVFEEATDTPILDDQTMTKRTSLTGNYRGTFTASAANGFEAGKWYNVVATATVGGTTDKTVALTFRVAPAESSAGVPKVDTSHVAGTSQTAGDIIGDTNDIQARLPAALTADGNMKSDTLRVGGTLQTAGDIIGDTNDIQTRLPAALVSGRMDSSVGAYASGLAPLQPTVAGRTLDVTAAGEAGIDLDNTSGALAKGTEITGFNDILAADVWAVATRILTAIDEDTTTLDLDATIRAAVGLAVANLDTQLGDLPTAAENFAAVLTTQLTEAYAADGVAPTLAQAIFLIQQSLHEFAIAGTTRTVKKLDGSTTAATFTLDSSTAPTTTTRAT